MILEAIELIYDNTLIKWVAKNGYDSEMGARPMERFITEKIKKPLVDRILDSKYKDGGSIKVSIKSDKVIFREIKSKTKVKK